MCLFKIRHKCCFLVKNVLLVNCCLFEPPVKPVPEQDDTDSPNQKDKDILKSWLGKYLPYLAGKETDDSYARDDPNQATQKVILESDMRYPGYHTEDGKADRGDTKENNRDHPSLGYQLTDMSNLLSREVMKWLVPKNSDNGKGQQGA